MLKVGNLSQNCHLWSYSVTQHGWTCPALTSARQAGTQFTYCAGMRGW